MKVTRKEPWVIDTKVVAKLVEKPGDIGRGREAMLYKWESIWGKRHRVRRATKDPTQFSSFYCSWGLDVQVLKSTPIACRHLGELFCFVLQPSSIVQESSTMVQGFNDQRRVTTNTSLTSGPAELGKLVEVLSVSLQGIKMTGEPLLKLGYKVELVTMGMPAVRSYHRSVDQWVSVLGRACSSKPRKTVALEPQAILRWLQRSTWIQLYLSCLTSSSALSHYTFQLYWPFPVSHVLPSPDPKTSLSPHY